MVGSGSGGWWCWYIWMIVFVVSARVSAMGRSGCEGVVVVSGCCG